MCRDAYIIPADERNPRSSQPNTPMTRILSAFAIGLAPLTATALPSDLLKKPDAWYASEDGRKTTASILSWQSPQGGWPKNNDTSKKPYSGSREKIEGTFDNKATTDELRYLAKAWHATRDEACKRAIRSHICLPTAADRYTRASPWTDKRCR